MRAHLLITVSAFALMAASAPANAAHQFYPYAETTIPHDHDSGEHPSGEGRAEPSGDGDGDGDGDSDDDDHCPKHDDGQEPY